MPTARELLEQADALMRRNRKRGRDKGEGPPTLTDVLADRNAALAPTLILPDAARADVEPIIVANAETADPLALDTLSDLPVLTDVVDVWPSSPDSPPARPPELLAPSTGLDDALEADALAGAVVLDGAQAIVGEDAEAVAGEDVRHTGVDAAEPRTRRTGAASAGLAGADGAAARASAVTIPKAADANEHATSPIADAHATSGISAEVDHADENVSAADVVEPHARPIALSADEEFILDIPPSDTGNALPPMRESEGKPYVRAEPSPTILPGSPDWNAMAEEIRMQVLQRLDLFTDTGMRDQLGARLQPIVNRASAELVETINRELGELVRGYVAEAIEREIESWRNRRDS